MLGGIYVQKAPRPILQSWNCNIFLTFCHFHAIFLKIYEFLGDYEKANKDFSISAKIDPGLEAEKKVLYNQKHVKHVNYLIENQVN